MVSAHSSTAEALYKTRLHSGWLPEHCHLAQQPEAAQPPQRNAQNGPKKVLRRPKLSRHACTPRELYPPPLALMMQYPTSKGQATAIQEHPLDIATQHTPKLTMSIQW